MAQVKQCEVGWHTFKLDQYAMNTAKDLEVILDMNVYQVLKLVETALVKGFVDTDNYRLFAKPIISSISEYGINFAIDLRLVIHDDTS